MTEEREAEIKKRAEMAILQLALFLEKTLSEAQKGLSEEELILFSKYYLAGCGGVLNTAPDDGEISVHDVIDMANDMYEEIYQEQG